jgi:alpha-amylase
MIILILETTIKMELETRFGSKTSYLIYKSTYWNIQVYADIVLNHNSGQLENKPIQEHKPILTLLESSFRKFPRTSADFYKNSYANNDDRYFWDSWLSTHVHKCKQTGSWTDGLVANITRILMKFDGWRFDYVKGFGPWVVKDWILMWVAFQLANTGTRT